MTSPPSGDQPGRARSINPTMLTVAHWQEVDALIRQADLKAQVLLGIDALLLAGLSRSAEAAVGGVAPVDTPLEFITLGLLLASIAMALVTVAPRRGQKPNPDALLFFQAVADQPAVDYVERYVAMSADELLRKVAFEIHAKSGVAARKLSRIRIGVALLAAAAITWSLALAVGL